MAALCGLFRLGRDAEIRKLQDGTPVLSLALAYNYGPKGSDGKRPSQWIDASMFGDRAEKLAQYLTKGSSIFATLDDPCIHTFQKKDGTSGVSLRAKVSQIEFAGGGQPAQAKPSPPPKPAAPPPTKGFEEDDIPF